MAKFYVTKEEMCPSCEGQKVVQVQIWKYYWEWFNDFKTKNEQRIPNYNEEQDWWAECGYWKNDPQEPIPPEEHDCPDCNGIGVTIEKVELADALHELTKMSAMNVQLAQGEQSLCHQAQLEVRNGDKMNQMKTREEWEDQIIVADHFCGVNIFDEMSALLDEIMALQENER